MSFSIEQFYRTNQKVLTWLLLALLLWAVRGYFGLIFVVYVLTLLVLPAARALHRRMRMPERAALTAIYLAALLAMGVFVRFVTPMVVGEANHLVSNLGAIQNRLIVLNEHFEERYPDLQAPLLGYLRSSLQDDVRERFEKDLSAEAQRLGLPDEAVRSPTRWSEGAEDDAAGSQLVRFEQERLLGSLFDEATSQVRHLAPSIVTGFYHGIATLALGLLFSFMILIDLQRLSQLVDSVQHSRLADFYRQTGPVIARLGRSISIAIRAQALIALANATLTTVGLAILGVPSIAMLAVIVFVCGFVPVIGTFVSTVPILLLAINGGGAGLVLGVLAMIIVIHAVEAYLLNPLIYGAEFELNPVLTLIILFVAYHTFGVWGMLLGLPVARYFMHDVFALGLESQGSAARGPLMP